MARTLIDLDEEALSAAAAELGTTTKVATVNEALREVGLRRPARRRELDRMRSGAYAELADPEARARAWGANR